MIRFGDRWVASGTYVFGLLVPLKLLSLALICLNSGRHLTYCVSHSPPKFDYAV